MIRLYWWSPVRDWKSLASESVHHHRAWAHVLRHGALRMSNFGDALNPLIVEELTQRRTQWAPIRDAELVAIGSVLNTYVSRGSEAMILGSGVRALDGAIQNGIDPAKVLAVRGKLTANAIGAPGLDRGDPGLLIREIVKGAKFKRREPLVVPHFAVPNTPEGRSQLSMLRAEGARIIQANEAPQAVAQAIAEAPYVITSSLHAMVFADSLGVPVQMTSFGPEGAAEPRFKYRDYESIFGVESGWHSIEETLHQLANQESAVSSAEARQATIAPQLDAVISGIYESAAPLRSTSWV